MCLQRTDDKFLLKQKTTITFFILSSIAGLDIAYLPVWIGHCGFRMLSNLESQRPAARDCGECGGLLVLNSARPQAGSVSGLINKTRMSLDDTTNVN